MGPPVVVVSKRFQPKRYQLKKQAAQVLLSGHPWIFRSHLGSAADIFPDGQFLQLMDHENKILGYGVFEKEGLIAIRVLKQGSVPPTTEWFQSMVDKALAKRKNLQNYSNAFRALHGENDGLSGIVVDVYAKVGVLQTYSPAVDTLGRYLSGVVRQRLSLEAVVWKLPVKRKATKVREPVRLLRGQAPGMTHFREGKMEFVVDTGEGQKSGAFLDLRGLRKWIASQDLNAKSVLNLFCYTGTLGFAAEAAKAGEIWNVDISEGAIAHGKKHHATKKERFRWVVADVFDWLKELSPRKQFDLIIVDPPQMASQVSQVPNALRAYKQLFRLVLPHLTDRGTLVICCCTSRISRTQFKMESERAFQGEVHFVKSLPPEDDHPIGFPEGDYLKILVYKKK